MVAVGKSYAMETDGKNLMSLVSADDLGIFTRMLLKAPSSPHPVYNVGGPATSPQDVAKALRKLIPEGKITFSDTPMVMRGGGLPWLVSGKRAQEDFGFSCLRLEESLKIHINDARMEAGLPPMKFKK
jgi:nucleoside-diphosphate-sugar epimerase